MPIKHFFLKKNRAISTCAYNRIFTLFEVSVQLIFTITFSLVQKVHTINGVNVHTQKALPKDGGQDGGGRNFNGGGGRGGHYNGGGGRGGGGHRGGRGNFGGRKDIYFFLKY